MYLVTGSLEHAWYTYVMMLESRILFGFLVMRSKTRPLEIQVRYPQPLPSTTLLGRPGL